MMETTVNNDTFHEDISIGCPCCTNRRLLDIVGKETCHGEIKIKCQRCKQIIRK